MICLDTTFIIDFLKSKQEAINKYKELKDKDLVTTHINVYETKSGIYRKFSEDTIIKELSVLDDFMSFIKILHVNMNSVEEAAKINGRLIKNGGIIDDLDILIAGICLSNGCSAILTKNKKHFDKIKGLKVETY